MQRARRKQVRDLITTILRVGLSCWRIRAEAMRANQSKTVPINRLTFLSAENLCPLHHLCIDQTL
jgi:hypothetical protein